MPIHDGTRVPAGLFHHFHQTWITRIADALNAGRLPRGLSALVEQRAAYVEVIGVGDVLPDMPLFVAGGLHVKVPLETTYNSTWATAPEEMRTLWNESAMPCSVGAVAPGINRRNSSPRAGRRG